MEKTFIVLSCVVIVKTLLYCLGYIENCIALTAQAVLNRLIFETFLDYAKRVESLKICSQTAKPQTRGPVYKKQIKQDIKDNFYKISNGFQINKAQKMLVWHNKEAQM